MFVPSPITVSSSCRVSMATLCLGFGDVAFIAISCGRSSSQATRFAGEPTVESPNELTVDGAFACP